MPLTREIRIIKVPLPDREKSRAYPKNFPPMPSLYLELLENKSKIKQDLINKEYIPQEYSRNRALENNSNKNNNIPDNHSHHTSHHHSHTHSRHHHPDNHTRDKRKEEYNNRHHSSGKNNRNDKDNRTSGNSSSSSNNSSGSSGSDSDSDSDTDSSSDNESLSSRSSKSLPEENRDKEKYNVGSYRESHIEKPDNNIRANGEKKSYQDNMEITEINENSIVSEHSSDNNKTSQIEVSSASTPISPISSDDEEEIGEAGEAANKNKESVEESGESNEANKSSDETDDEDHLSERLNELLRDSSESASHSPSGAGSGSPESHAGSHAGSYAASYASSSKRSASTSRAISEKYATPPRKSTDLYSKYTPYDKYKELKQNQPVKPPAPTLAELEAKGQFQHKQELRDINHVPLAEHEEEDKKRELIFKYNILRKSYPEAAATIPEYTVLSDYREMTKNYDDTVRRLSLDSTVNSYKQYLFWGFMAVEYIFGKFLGFDMAGFTQQQMVSLPNYEKLLIELGEKSYVPSGSRWPVEIRLLFMIILNAAFFIVGKMIMKSTGANIMNMMPTQSGSGGGAGGATSHAQQPQKPKRRMQGPSLNIDDIPTTIPTTQQAPPDNATIGSTIGPHHSPQRRGILTRGS